MKTSGRQACARLALALVVVLALVAVPAIPAGADHNAPPAGPVAGSGQLEGTERVLDETYVPPACFQTRKIVMDLGGEGTYHGRRADGSEVVYRAQLAEGQPRREGPLRVEVENDLPFYHGPQGTHGGDSACSPATAGTPIEASFRIFATDHVYRLEAGGAQVPCAGRGSFVREGTSGDWHADWTLAQDCIVVGNQAGVPGEGTAPVGTAHTHRGVHAPCFNVCTTNIRIDYAQHLPPDGLAVTLGGPAAALVGDLVTVTAGVTDDGVAVAGAAVAFTVGGPAPAEPPGATSPTDTAGRASFSFTAAVAGDYTVSATATAAGEPGKVVSATHTVSFGTRRPNMTLLGPDRAQTEEEVILRADVYEDSPDVNGLYLRVSGAYVDFTVSGPGQATPSQATVVSNAGGQAYFSFVADRAGDYTVTATSTLQSGTVTRTHVVRLDINSLKHVASISLPDEKPLSVAVVDPAGQFAYFGASGRVVKVDLSTFQPVGALPVAVDPHSSAVIDPAGRYAYFAGGRRVAKVDLATFQEAGLLTLAPEELHLTAAVVDPAGNFAYFGVEDVGGYAGRVVKLDLATFQRVGAITFGPGEMINEAVIDPAGSFAYFATEGSGPRIVKVELATFQRAGTLTLASGDGVVESGVVDPAGSSAYFGTRNPAGVVKVDLGAFQRVGALSLPWPWTEGTNGDELGSATVDPAGRFAYFGSRAYFQDPNSLTDNATGTQTARVIRVDLAAFQVAHVLTPDAVAQDLTSAVMAPDGSHAYFGTRPETARPWEEQQPPKILELALTRPPAPWLAAGDDTYATPYATPLAVAAPGVLANDADTGDGDPLTAHHASDPPGGSVSLNPDGSFTYTPDAGFSGTDTFTYTASDGMDYSAPATVSVTVDPPPEGVASVVASAYGYHTNVSLFGGPYEPRGPAPTVAVEANAANSPQDAHVDSAEAVYGPAVIFRSGPIDVHAEGDLGRGGHAASQATVTGHPDPARRPGPFLYDGVAASCRADDTGRVTPAVSITNGVVETSYYVEDDPSTPETEQGGDVRTTEAVPPNPPPGYAIEGTLDHVGDRFRIVFNEQVQNPDGSTTVVGAHMYLLGPTAVGDAFIAHSVCGVEATASAGLGATVDFDGDARSDLGVFRPSTGVWYLHQSTAGNSATTFGAPGDIAVPADYDGDGKVDQAVFRPSTGVWYLRQSTAGDASVRFGTEGDVPTPADYDGDAKADIALFRPSTGVWYLLQSTAGAASVPFGTSGDVPVVGDYDGDAKADIGVFRPATGVWYLRQSTAGNTAVSFGTNGDIPVPADYDGDAKADIGVFRPSTGVWYLRPGGGSPTAATFGTSGDVPNPADYDGDAKADIGVFRPSSGVWYLRQTTAGASSTRFGTNGDVPLSLPAAIYRAFF